MAAPLILNLGWNGFGSNFTGWVGIGSENLSHEDLYLSHPGLLTFCIMCEIDARGDAESLALICAFVSEISQENDRAP